MAKELALTIAISLMRIPLPAFTDWRTFIVNEQAIIQCHNPFYFLW